MAKNKQKEENKIQKSRIEWTDYTLNPVKGLCPVDCKDNNGKSYCYARAMYKRFKWNSEIRFDCTTLNWKPPAGSRVFVGSTMELFGDWINPEWMGHIAQWMKSSPLTTFIFLTKQPQNLLKFSPFPENCWVGVSIPRYWDDSAVGHPEAFNRIRLLGEVKASVKFISFEPLLTPIASEFEFGLDMAFKAYGINWIIIGAQTPRSEKTFPRWAWVKEIIEAADIASVPVFLKPNLGLLKYSCEGSAPFYKRTFTEDTWELRQEMP